MDMKTKIKLEKATINLLAGAFFFFAIFKNEKQAKNIRS
jgi:hypothetical protein